MNPDGMHKQFNLTAVRANLARLPGGPWAWTTDIHGGPTHVRIGEDTAFTTDDETLPERLSAALAGIPYLIRSVDRLQRMLAAAIGRLDADGLHAVAEADPGPEPRLTAEQLDGLNATVDAVIDDITGTTPRDDTGGLAAAPEYERTLTVTITGDIDDNLTEPVTAALHALDLGPDVEIDWKYSETRRFVPDPAPTILILQLSGAPSDIAWAQRTTFLDSFAEDLLSDRFASGGWADLDSRDAEGDTLTLTLTLNHFLGTPRQVAARLGGDDAARRLHPLGLRVTGATLRGPDGTHHVPLPDDVR